MILFLVFLFLFSSRGWAQEPEPEPAWNLREEIYFTLEGALRRIFPDAERIETEKVDLDPEARERVAQSVGHPLHEEKFLVYRGIKGNQSLGFAVVGEEFGKFRPITSLVAIGPDGKVKEVLVLVYRESRGGEVRHKRFLGQYRGKDLRDPLRINRDILSISGATISVRSMNAQVRKVLHVIREAYFLVAEDT